MINDSSIITHHCSVQSILDHYQSCFYQFRVADLQAQLISGNHVRLDPDLDHLGRTISRVLLIFMHYYYVILPLRQNWQFLFSRDEFWISRYSRFLSKLFARRDLSPTEMRSRHDNRPEIGLLTLLPKSEIIIPHRVTRICPAECKIIFGYFSLWHFSTQNLVFWLKKSLWCLFNGFWGSLNLCW